MISKLIAKKIAHKLTDYIHDINENQLTLAITKGTLSLDNVSIKLDKIQNYVNFKIEKILIKHLSVKIPYNFLYNSVEILCKGVYVFLNRNLDLTKEFLIFEKLQKIEEEINKMFGKNKGNNFIMQKIIETNCKIEEINFIYSYKDKENAGEYVNLSEIHFENNVVKETSNLYDTQGYQINSGNLTSENSKINMNKQDYNGENMFSSKNDELKNEMYKINVERENFVIRIDQVIVTEAKRNNNEKKRAEQYKNVVIDNFVAFYTNKSYKKVILKEKSIEFSIKAYQDENNDSANNQNSLSYYDIFIKTKEINCNMPLDIQKKIAKIYKSYSEIQEMRNLVANDDFYSNFDFEKITKKSFYSLLEQNKKQEEPTNENMQKYKAIINKKEAELHKDELDFKINFEYKYSKKQIIRIKSEVITEQPVVTRKFYFWKQTSEKKILNEEIQKQSVTKFLVNLESDRIELNLAKPKQNVKLELDNTRIHINEIKNAFKVMINNLRMKKNEKIYLESNTKNDFIKITCDKNKLSVTVNRFLIYKPESLYRAVRKHFNTNLISKVKSNKTSASMLKRTPTNNDSCLKEYNILIKNVTCKVDNKTSIKCNLLTFLSVNKQIFSKIENLRFCKKKKMTYVIQFMRL